MKRNLLTEEFWKNKAFFATMFGDIAQEISLKLLLSLTDQSILKKRKSTEHEIKLIKNLALEKLHRQKCLMEDFALQLLE